MANLADIYAIWDDNAETLATEIGEAGVTVRQWRNRNSIPRRAWGKIIDAADKRGRSLSLADFDAELAALAQQAAA